MSGWIVFMFLGLFLAFVLFAIISTWLTVRRLRRRLDERDVQVRTAAAEAAEDDEAFAADRVTQDVTVMFHAIQGAWDARDETALGTLVGNDLLVEWHRRLGDFARKGWHNRVRVITGPGGALRRAHEPRARRGGPHRRPHLREPRGLRRGPRRHARHARRNQHDDHRAARVLDPRQARPALDPRSSIEQDAEGSHQLDAPLVASPWADARVADEALVEGAVADAALPGVATAELVDVDLAGDARVQALDLSLADARFGPDVLAAAARRAAEAWSDAVDGEDAPLLEVATPGAVDALLYGGDASHDSRLVVRGPRIDGVTIEQLEASPEPAHMTLAVHVRGRRYVENRDTAAILSGSRDRETAFTERWTMALDGTDATPWRLVGVAD